MCLVLQKSHYYLKCQVTSARFKPWAFTGQVLYQSIFLYLLFDVYEPSLGCLVKTVGLFWNLISSCNTTAYRRNDHSPVKQLIYDLASWGLPFLSRTETSWVIFSELIKKFKNQIKRVCLHCLFNLKSHCVPILIYTRKQHHLRTLFTLV